MTERREQRIKNVLKQRKFDVSILLENVHDPHNISAVMRTCDSVGIQEINILKTSSSLPYKWSKRTSSSANKWLTINTYTNLEECMTVLKKKFKTIYTSHLSTENPGISLYECNFEDSCLFIFGNERLGISKELMSYSNQNFFIPQIGIIQSLNISVACAVTIYEMFRQREVLKNTSKFQNQNMGNKELEELYQRFNISTTK